MRCRSGDRLLRPRRARCRACAGTHVLLSEIVFLRRRDEVSVIGAAIEASVAGEGYRRIAARLGACADTVRGWLRRFVRRAELVRAHFTRLRGRAGSGARAGAAGRERRRGCVGGDRGCWCGRGCCGSGRRIRGGSRPGCRAGCCWPTRVPALQECGELRRSGARVRERWKSQSVRSVVGRSACSGTRSSGMRPTPDCRRRSAAGWSVRSPTGTTWGRTVGWSGSAARRWDGGSARTVMAGSRRLFPSRAWSTPRTPAGAARARVPVEAGAAGADRGAGPGDHARHRRRRSGAGVADVADAPRSSGAQRSCGRPRRRGRSMAASRPRCATSCGRGMACTAPSWPAPARRAVLLAFIDDHCGCWSAGGGAPARTCSGWRPRCAQG